MSGNASPNAIDVESVNGVPAAYKCNYHVQTGAINDSSGKEIPCYYEMIHPCSQDPQDAIKTVASELLTNLGTTFRLLPSGDACTIPDTSLAAWVIGESSSPDDSVVPNMTCTKLSTGSNTDMCCVVVNAPMTFWVANAPDFQDQDLMGYIASELDSGALSYQTSYIGSVVQSNFEGGHNQIAPPTNTDDGTGSTIAGIQQATPSNQDKHHISVIGGFLMAALIVVFLAGVAVLFHRKRNSSKELDGGSVRKSSIDFIDGSDSEGPTLEVDVLSDDMPHHNVIARNNSFGLEDPPGDLYPQQNYTFDIADNMKNDIMGRYGSRRVFGPTTMAVVPPYPMEETSDSEADSWAQTDGTVGSLEDNLEQITAEI